MTVNYDVVVIGAGPGGYVAAIQAAQIGFKVALIEKDKNLGGTCLLRGCIPTKALLESASIYQKVKHASDFGVNVSEVVLDFSEVKKYKGKIVLKSAKGVDYLMNKNKITVLKGIGKVLSSNSVSVKSEDGKEQVVNTRFILLATGSVPREIPTLGTDGKSIINSDHILELDKLPKSLGIIGAGAIGVEFASVYSRFGVDVTLIELLPRILPIEDESISAELERALHKQGIKIKTSTRVQKAEVKNGNVEVVLQDAKDNTDILQVEKLLVAVGRRAVSDGIGLDKTKVVIEKNGYIKINEFMQTNEPTIYAVGDVVNTPWLAHVASAEGILAVKHMAGKDVRPLNYDQVPSCTYCHPEVASVGLSEAKAKERGYSVKVGTFPFTANGKARILNETEGFVKIVSDEKYDEILGIHIIGPHATELIAESCVALRGELTTEELINTIHAHPTLSEAVMEAAHSVLGHAIHI